MGNFCKKCGDYLLYKDKHKCYKFEFRIEGEYADDDWAYIWGLDFEDVAEKVGERYNADENDLIDDEIIVAIRKDGIENKYNVSASISIDFSVSKI